MEWTASDSSPTGSARAFISYLFKPTELDAVNPSHAIRLKPQTRSLLLLQATLGSISVGRDAGLIYRACQNSFLHLTATCNNQPHCSAHYTAAANRAQGHSLFTAHGLDRWSSILHSWSVFYSGMQQSWHDIPKTVVWDDCPMGRKLHQVISCNLRNCSQNYLTGLPSFLKTSIPEIGDIPASLSCYADVLRHIRTHEVVLMKRRKLKL